MSYRVAGIVGSLASTSINQQLFDGIARLASEVDLDVVQLPLAPLPMFNADLETTLPSAVVEFKAGIEGAAGLIIVTPEYNRSIPGVLKNALDWASRPWGHNSVAGKPTAIVGTSAGPLATALAQRHLRDVLSFLDARLLHQPEAYVRFSEGLISAKGEIADARQAEVLRKWLVGFAALI